MYKIEDDLIDFFADQYLNHTPEYRKHFPFINYLSMSYGKHIRTLQKRISTCH